MKIWFDLSNSPHINMFRTMIRDLQRSHEVIVTSRPLANTEDLLRMHNQGMEHLQSLLINAHHSAYDALLSFWLVSMSVVGRHVG